jgi:biopolymer transport protein ExbB/TolQ
VTPTLEKLMRETVEQRRRIRELEAERAEADRRVNVTVALSHLLSQKLDQTRARIAELEHVERVAAELMARLATLGTVIAHDDAARILAQALKKQ